MINSFFINFTLWELWEQESKANQSLCWSITWPFLPLCVALPVRTVTGKRCRI